MENEEAQAEESSHPPGMVSQVELSYVALNMKQINPSETDHLVKTAPPGVTRNSIRDGEIKIRVKSFSVEEEPKLEQETEDGEENEYEHEADSEQQNEEEGDQMGEKPPHEYPSLTSHLADVEDVESNAETVPTTPPSTPRGGESEFALLDEMENEGEGSGESEGGEEEPSTSDAIDEDELKKENIHHTLLEKECVIPEVIIVWEYISKFIIQKMLEGFAVKIPGVGTFSHAVLPNDVLKNKKNPDKFALRKTRKFPVFKICPHLKEMYRLSEENYLYQCNVCVVKDKLSHRYFYAIKPIYYNLSDSNSSIKCSCCCLQRQTVSWLCGGNYH